MRSRSRGSAVNSSSVSTEKATQGSTKNSPQTENEVAVTRLRWLLVGALVGSALLVSVLVYLYTSTRERNEFEAQLNSDAKKVLANVGQTFVGTMGAADGFMNRVVYQGRGTSNSTWPMVPTIPGLAVQAAKLIAQTNSIYMAFYPLITKEQRPTWENFTRDNDDWVDSALRAQAKNPNFHGPILTNFSKSHIIWNNEGEEPQNASGPFLPSWMGSPVIPYYYPYNWNSLAYPAFAKGLLHTIHNKSLVVTAVANHADPNDPEAVSQANVTSDWAIPYLYPGEDPNEPFSDMYYPVIDNFDDESVLIDTSTNQPALGAVAFSFYWRHMLKNILPPYSKGLITVFENPCNNNQQFTYRIDGPTPTFLGFGDWHQPKFDDLATSASLSTLTQSPKRGDYSYTGVPMTDQFCPWTLTVYPSDSMESAFVTYAPIWFALGSTCIFVFVAALFWVYDTLVRQEFNAKEQLLQAKRHFMRFVSHEVRTPLNAVCLGLACLQDELKVAVEEDIATTNGKHVSSQTTINSNETDQTMDGTSLSSSDRSRSSSRALQLEQWLNLTKEICDSAESSTEVLNDLLNYDKIQMGSFTMELSVLSLWNLVQETSREFRLSARHKNIQFTLENYLLLADVSSRDHFSTSDPEDAASVLQSFKIVADSIRLSQILRNLVSNAIKFTPEGGHLTIRVSWHSLGDQSYSKSSSLDAYELKSGEEVAFERYGTAVIQVMDDGAGMSESQLQALFQDGAQFNVNELQAGQGSGLGLFISKGMAEQHGGALRASSDGLGHGSTFTLEVPLYQIFDSATATTESTSPSPAISDTTQSHITTTEASPHPPPSSLSPPLEAMQDGIASTPPPKPSSPSLCILVVDDVASNRKLISRMARNRHHHVDEACDGREAVDKVQAAMEDERPYDVILMDYEMPVLRGPDAVVEIRELGCHKTFIAGVTGNVLEEDVRYFMSCGADCVIAKPIKFGLLEEKWVEHGILVAEGK